MEGQESIRAQYQRYGVKEFYERFGGDYSNPHERAIQHALQAAVETWPVDLSRVLDLACGSGEATLALKALGADKIDGVDPYTAEAYFARTGQTAEPFTFEQIAAGALAAAGRSYSLIVCSFALHLLQPSRLPALTYQLSLLADSLLILTPHKRPALKPEWGWTLTGELVVERVRVRYFKSGVRTGT
ncbi:MAG: class I SAM-dependent methyltransferase [Chloroflexi bacterium]|nr:class I SAM-dependent methyltransferase [Chloroflexota bacterium]